MTQRPVVYLSSTFEDLKQERRRVLDIVATQEVAASAMENYGASDGPALEKCVQDVERADIYVGLVGWKYGFVPPGSKASITEAEFEAATRAGIPRLMYFASEALRPQTCSDDDPVHGYRDRISAQPLVRRTFRDEAELATFVTSDLIRELTLLLATRLPQQELLPYLCDREPQTQAVVDEVATLGDAHPAVCLLYGAGNQSPLKFLDCLSRVHLPECLGASRGTTSEYAIPWPQPTRGGIARSICLNIARTLGLDVRASPDELETAVRGALEDHSVPVLLTFQAPTSKLDAQGLEQLRALAQYFRSWPQRKPELVVVCLAYSAGKPQVESRVRTIVTELDGSATELLRVLPVLGSVGEDEAVAWTRLPDLESIALETDLEGGVGLIFKDCEELPMEDLAPKLHELLSDRRRRR